MSIAGKGCSFVNTATGSGELQVFVLYLIQIPVWIHKLFLSNKSSGKVMVAGQQLFEQRLYAVILC